MRRPLLLVAVAVALAGCTQGHGRSLPDDRITATVHADSPVTVSLAVADDPAERRQGLANISHLPEKTGMLFAWEDSAPRTFWMKDTRIALDIIFLNRTRHITHIAHADPEPGVPPQQLTRYRSRGDARYVIELPQGFSDRYGVERGDRVTLSAPS